jgi:hypothetical protein
MTDEATEPGPPAESMTLLSFAGGVRGYCVMLADDDGARAVRLLPSGRLEATASERGEQGRQLLESDSGPLELAWTPAGPLLEFSVGIPAVRSYPVAATAATPDETFSGPGVAWELPMAGFSAWRTIWAATEKRGLTLLVAGRPEESTTHDEELIGAARMIPDAEPYGYAEPLVSTEYDAAGQHVRATLELWPDFDEHAPERGGGRRLEGVTLNGGEDGRRLEAARFAWTMEGSIAVGGYEILTA